MRRMENEERTVDGDGAVERLVQELCDVGAVTEGTRSLVRTTLRLAYSMGERDAMATYARDLRKVLDTAEGEVHVDVAEELGDLCAGTCWVTFKDDPTTAHKCPGCRACATPSNGTESKEE